MPLYQTISVTPDTTVYLWNVTESEVELSRDIELTENSTIRVHGMKSEIHRRGYLSIRHLLALAGYTDNDLYYDEIGKPHLRDGTHISITHSGVFTGIIVGSRIAVGIDIERQRQKILRIANKFTPPKEYNCIVDDDALIRKLTIVGGAKESLYKIYATKGISFLQHIISWMPIMITLHTLQLLVVEVQISKHCNLKIVATESIIHYTSSELS